MLVKPSDTNIERSYTVFESFQRSIQFLDQLGFKYRFMSTSGDLCTTAFFLQHNGYVVDEVEGLGKGRGLQSFVSSACESIEHYLHDTVFFQSYSSIMTVDELVLKNEDVSKDMGVSMLLSDKSFSNKNIRIIKLTGLSNSSEIAMPAFLLDPSYLEDYPMGYWNDDFVATSYYSNMPPHAIKYSTNSGSALGFNSEDAILHGLLETVERDAHSLFQLQTVFMNKWEKTFVLDRTKISNIISSLWVEVEKLIGQEIIVFDITTDDIGIPVYIALPAYHHSSHGSLHGCGCSLYPEYAIERALLEILQVYQARGILLKNYALQNHEKDMKNLLSYIDHIRGYKDNPYIEKVLGTNNIKRLTNTCMKKDINFSSPQMNTKCQVSYIVNLLKDKGFNSYAITIEHDGVFLSHVVVPGLEKFNCIDYCVIAPGKRGQNFCNHQIA